MMGDAAQKFRKAFLQDNINFQNKRGSFKGWRRIEDGNLGAKEADF